MPELFNAEVMQFMRPNGRQVTQKTGLPIDCMEEYAQMEKDGFRFEAEVLTDGQISITISGFDEDADIELVKNGPDVQKTMREMLKRGQWKEVLERIDA